jgi:uncharacterized membrane protein
MPTPEPDLLTCAICGQPKPKSMLVPAVIIRPGVSDLIRQQYLEWSPDSLICHDDLTYFRGLHVQNLLESEKGELTVLEDAVVHSLREHEILSTNVDTAFEEQLSAGARLADAIAAFGGSWAFIGVFGIFILLWICVNVVTLLWKPPDPYPFILLNLILSCLAALQAPVIMMSQNRQEAKDRLRSEHDYRINLKAELEIRHLHEKVDHLLLHQWERLTELQQLQLDLLNEVVKSAMPPPEEPPQSV